MKTRKNPIAAVFHSTSAVAHLIARHIAYTKDNILSPLRTAAADLLLLVAGFALLTTQMKDLMI